MNASFEIAERIEQAAWEDLFRAVSPRDRERLGLKAERSADTLLLACPVIDHPLFNRLIGWSAARRGHDDVLDRALRDFDDVGASRFFVHRHAASGPGETILHSRGLRRYHRSWIKLMRGATVPPALTTDLEIGDARPDEASSWAEILRQGFNLPLSSVSPLAGLVGRERWHAVIARDHGQPAAAGALYIEAGVGYLALAATLPRYRKRGAQGALMTARISRAVELGCRWVATETGEEVPGDPNHSFRNMLRCGFSPVGSRENWVAARGESARPLRTVSDGQRSSRGPLVGGSRTERAAS